MKNEEQIISELLYNLPDSDPLWAQIDRTFNHQVCFKNYWNEEVQQCPRIAKKWYKELLDGVGKRKLKPLRMRALNNN
jgi:hypothetical protein